MTKHNSGSTRQRKTRPGYIAIENGEIRTGGKSPLVRKAQAFHGCHLTQTAQHINRASLKSKFSTSMLFEQASWLEIGHSLVELPPYLQKSLDRGEASVIQTA